jgi:hypothetical protein
MFDDRSRRSLTTIVMQSLIDSLKFWCCCSVVVVTIYCCQVMPVLAAPTPIAKPIELKISLGNTANELKFFPDSEVLPWQVAFN